MRWLLLGAAIVSEVTAALALQAAVDAPGWYALVVAGYLAAFGFLTRVLKAGMAVGVAYGIWGASGVALTAVGATVLFGQPLTGPMIIGLVLIVAGVLLVEIGSQRAHAARAAEGSTPGTASAHGEAPAAAPSRSTPTGGTR